MSDQYVESFAGFGISGPRRQFRLAVAPMLRRFQSNVVDCNELSCRYFEIGPFKAALRDKRSFSMRAVGTSLYLNIILVKVMIVLLPFRWKWPTFKRRDDGVLYATAGAGPFILHIGRMEYVA